MRRRPNARGGIGVFAGLRADLRDEFRSILRREILTHDQHVGGNANLRDRGKILGHVIRGALHQRRRGERPGGRRQDGVAIGRGLRHQIGADHAAGAGAIFRHNRLAPRFGDLGRGDAGHKVSRLTGRPGHNQAQRA